MIEQDINKYRIINLLMVLIVLSMGIFLTQPSWIDHPIEDHLSALEPLLRGTYDTHWILQHHNEQQVAFSKLLEIFTGLFLGWDYYWMTALNSVFLGLAALLFLDSFLRYKVIPISIWGLLFLSSLLLRILSLAPTNIWTYPGHVGLTLGILLIYAFAALWEKYLLERKNGLWVGVVLLVGMIAFSIFLPVYFFIVFHFILFRVFYRRKTTVSWSLFGLAAFGLLFFFYFYHPRAEMPNLSEHFMKWPARVAYFAYQLFKKSYLGPFSIVGNWVLSSILVLFFIVLGMTVFRWRKDFIEKILGRHPLLFIGSMMIAMVAVGRAYAGFLQFIQLQYAAYAMPFLIGILIFIAREGFSVEKQSRFVKHFRFAFNTFAALIFLVSFSGYVIEWFQVIPFLNEGNRINNRYTRVFHEIRTHLKGKNWSQKNIHLLFLFSMDTPIKPPYYLPKVTLANMVTFPEHVYQIATYEIVASHGFTKLVQEEGQFPDPIIQHYADGTSLTKYSDDASFCQALANRNTEKTWMVFTIQYFKEPVIENVPVESLCNFVRRQ